MPTDIQDSVLGSVGAGSRQSSAGVAAKALRGDIEGPILHVAMQIDVGQFSDAEAGLRLAAYGNLLKSFDAATLVTILVDEQLPATIETWLAKLSPACRIELLRVQGNAISASSAWVRDAFLPGATGNGLCYFRPRISKKSAEPADYLAAASGASVVPLHDLFLDGGDSIVAIDFRLVGVEAVRRTRRVEGYHCSLAVAVARLQSLDARPMTVVGYRPAALEKPFLAFKQDVKRRMPPRAAAMPRRQRAGGLILGALRTVAEIFRTYLLNELVQDWAHIDVVVSPTGVNDLERPQLLVAQMPRPATSKGQDFDAWQRLEALAIHLQSCGFRVGRNPTAYDHENDVTLWYNNVLLQRDPPVVWLPQYEREDGTYSGTDAANAQIWRDLGYSIRRVAGWHAYVGAEGAIRCATNVLERAEELRPAVSSQW